MKTRTIDFILMRNDLHHSYKSRRFLQTVAFILVLSFLNMSLGCNYYLVRTQTRHEGDLTPSIKQLQAQRKVFILHFGDEAGLLKNMFINADKNAIYAEMGELPPQHMTYQKTDPSRVQRYKLKERELLREVHIYVTEYATTKDEG